MQLDDIWGNEMAKRAVEIALRGKLSIKFIGNGEAEMFKNYCQEQKLKAYNFKPCDCGHYGDAIIECTCNPKQLKENQKLIENCKTDLTLSVSRFRVSKFDKVKLPYKLDEDCKQLMSTAIERMNLDQQQVLSTLKVANTIAELENQVEIKLQHIAEALQYRERR